MRTRWIILVLMVTIPLTLPVMGGAANIELKIGHLSAVGGIEDLAVQKIREVVEQQTKGAIKVKVFPGAQLGNIILTIKKAHFTGKIASKRQAISMLKTTVEAGYAPKSQKTQCSGHN